jgi:chromosome partitioning protein
MKTIAFICQKGGTGKTTLAISLATAAIADGLTVAIIDLDPQVSACEWGDIRKADAPVVIDAQPARIEAVVERAREMGIDLLLIDTAGRTEQAALAGARVADLVLVPLQPSVIDLKTIRATCDLIDLAGNRACRFVRLPLATGLPSRTPMRRDAAHPRSSRAVRPPPRYDKYMSMQVYN